jgi:hypothetical protein
MRRITPKNRAKAKPASGADRISNAVLFDGPSAGCLIELKFKMGQLLWGLAKFDFSKVIRADSEGEKMKSLVHLAFGALLLSVVAFHAGATGTNKLCNGRQTDIVFAVIHEGSDDPGSRCELHESTCYVTLQGWYTMRPGVCMNVDMGARWESYLSIFIKDTAAGQYRPEIFPVNDRFYKDRDEKNSGVVNVTVCMPVGPFKKKLPGALAPMLNPAVACDPGEALHPVNYVMRAGPETHVMVTVN